MTSNRASWRSNIRSPHRRQDYGALVRRANGEGDLPVLPASRLIPYATMACAVVGIMIYLSGRIPSRTFSDADFGIVTYVSPNDADGDGIDDQADMLLSAKAYVDTKPSYASDYYHGGWPDDGRGACTDVVAQAMLGMGVDLRLFMAHDMEDRPEAYADDAGDMDIAFRRVRNQIVWLDAHTTRLTTDVGDIVQWQSGDIVAYRSPEHIAIVSDRRNEQGRPFVIHHGSPWQTSYEEDRLADWGGPIGHWRIG